MNVFKERSCVFFCLSIAIYKVEKKTNNNNIRTLRAVKQYIHKCVDIFLLLFLIFDEQKKNPNIYKIIPYAWILDIIQLESNRLVNVKKEVNSIRRRAVISSSETMTSPIL